MGLCRTPNRYGIPSDDAGAFEKVLRSRVDDRFDEHKDLLHHVRTGGGVAANVMACCWDRVDSKVMLVPYCAVDYCAAAVGAAKVGYQGSSDGATRRRIYRHFSTGVPLWLLSRGMSVRKGYRVVFWGTENERDGVVVPPIVPGGCVGHVKFMASGFSRTGVVVSPPPPCALSMREVCDAGWCSGGHCLGCERVRVTLGLYYFPSLRCQFNCGEACNFSLPSWIPFGRVCIDKYRRLGRPSVLVHEELIFGLVQHAQAMRPDDCEEYVITVVHDLWVPCTSD